MDKDFSPILVVAAVPHNEGIRFLHYECQIDIEKPMSQKIWQIIEHCNGYNNVDDIAELSHLPREEVIDIISELVNLEIIVDSRQQFLHFHKIRNYPAIFTRDLTQEEIIKYTASPRKSPKKGQKFEFSNNAETVFTQLLEKRRSCRSFSTKKLSLDQIGNICHYAYSIHDHAVPSGGALYPLKIYVLVESEQKNMACGYYEYDPERDSLILFDSIVDEEQLKYCFNQETMPFGSSVQIIIAADLERQTFKYSNRGYMLTLIEVGHAAENISLYCAEQGLGACEMGGILDEPLKEELKLDDDVWPIIAIAIGYCSNKESELEDKLYFAQKNTGSQLPVKNFWIETFEEGSSFFGAGATYENQLGEKQYAGATATSYDNAVFKAVIEGYERWSSGQVKVDFHGKAEELGNWLDPQKIFPLTPEQARLCGLTPFSESLDIDWTLGIDHDGSEIFVPSDIVYYGQRPHENQIYYGHSSGIAAYTNREEAKKRALIELIERDALMRNWYSHQPLQIVGKSCLSSHVKKRSEFWKRHGRQMQLLLVPSDYGIVLETIITSKEYPCFVSGAAATIDFKNILETMHKSVQEAEYILFLALKNPTTPNVNPHKIQTPMEHGEFYFTEKNATKLSWLTEGSTIEKIPDLKHESTKTLLHKLQAITVDLPKYISGLYVVRILSPKLVPINFGYYTAHYTHPKLSGNINPCSLKFPHYFA